MEDKKTLDVNLDPKKSQNLKRVLDAVAENLPNYQTAIKKMLLEMIYDGPPIIMPKSFPIESLIDVLAFLKRQEIEKCQLLSKNYRLLINQHSRIWPLHIFDELRVENSGPRDNHWMEASVQTTDVKKDDRFDLINTLLFSYRPEQGGDDPWDYGKGLTNHLKNVSISDIRFIGFEGDETKEKFWKFMNKMHELVGEKLNVRNKALEDDVDSEDIQKLSATMIQTPKLEVRIDPWLETPENHSLGFNADQVWISFTGDFAEGYTFDRMFRFIQNAKFPDLNKYYIHLWSDELPGITLIDLWLEFYAKQEDPLAVNRNIDVSINDPTFDTEADFVSHTFTRVKDCPKTIKFHDTPREDEYGKTYYSTALYVVKKTDKYVMDVTFKLQWPPKKDEALNELKEKAEKVDLEERLRQIIRINFAIEPK